MLHLSYRQLKRINRRFLKSEAKGLVHGNAGKRSNRRWQRLIWRRTMGSGWMQRPCADG